MRAPWIRSATTTPVPAFLPALLCFVAAASNVSAERSVLATPGQLERERRTLEVLASEPMREAIAELERAYLANPRGASPSGAATARRAAESTAAAAVHGIVNEDPRRPVVFWGANAPHVWHGLSLPRSGYGIENPDNVYRSVHVEGASRYELRGRMPSRGPIEQHYTVMDRVPGTGKEMPVEGAAFVATLRSDALEVAPDGRFVVTIDADPANGRPNHLRIPSEGEFPLHVRDLFTRWSEQDPIALDVVRVGGPPPGPASPTDELARRAALRLRQMGLFWLAWNDRHLYSRAANEITAPRLRPGGRGLSTAGHFALAHDEALVLTLDPLDAGSFGVQLADPWGVALEYVERTSSLNQTQAAANEDGTYSFVVSARDPGVANWLDSEGHASGILVARWQVLPTDDPDVGRSIRRVEVVKLDRLREALPREMRFVTAEERARRRSERARAYARRLGD